MCDVVRPVAPEGPAIGELWYNTSVHLLLRWDGRVWRPLARGREPGELVRMLDVSSVAFLERYAPADWQTKRAKVSHAFATVPEDLSWLAATSMFVGEAPWWERLAADAIVDGRFRRIARRDGSTKFYRFWIAGGGDENGDDELESERSILLHWHVNEDDDGHLHDHPWSMAVRVLAGAYLEQLRTDALKRSEVTNRAGAEFVLDKGEAATYRHRIARVYGSAWSLVVTRERFRKWGYDTAAGWVAFDEYRKATS